MLMLVMCGVSSVSMATPTAWTDNLQKSIQNVRGKTNDAFNATRLGSLAAFYPDIMKSFTDALETFNSTLTSNVTVSAMLTNYKTMITSMEKVKQNAKASPSNEESKLFMCSQFDSIICLQKMMILFHAKADASGNTISKAHIDKVKESIDSFVKAVKEAKDIFANAGTSTDYKLPHNYTDNLARDTFVTLTKAMSPQDKELCIKLLTEYYGREEKYRYPRDNAKHIGIRETYWGKLHVRKDALLHNNESAKEDIKKLTPDLNVIKKYYDNNVKTIKEEIEKLEKSLFEPANVANFETLKGQLISKYSLIVLLADLTQILLSPKPADASAASIEELFLDILIQSLVFDAGKAEIEAKIAELQKDNETLFNSTRWGIESTEQNVEKAVKKEMTDPKYNGTDRAIAIEYIQKLIKEAKDAASVTAPAGKEQQGTKRPGEVQIGSASKKPRILTEDAYNVLSGNGMIDCKGLHYNEYIKNPSIVDASQCPENCFLPNPS